VFVLTIEVARVSWHAVAGRGASGLSFGGDAARD
jgi:hypothetical protein